MKPYTRLVRHPGNNSLFNALEMSILSTVRGQPLHVHVEGLRGTGKTTIMRGAKQILPLLERVKGCVYNCDPRRPHCPQHRGMDAEMLARCGTEMIPMPFLEISHSAKIGTAVGSIDLARITDRSAAEAALLPGTIPQAHRGIVFVDEINRLADVAPELADVLLDVMGTKPGRVQIEESGLPTVEIPVRISVWSASNPDEEPGPLEDIRKQLADRFDFVVNMTRPTTAETIQNILDQNAALEADAPGVLVSEQPRLERLRQRFLDLAGLGDRVVIPEEIGRLIATLFIDFSLESIRAVEAIHLGVRVSAALGRRDRVCARDLCNVVPLALQHRVDVHSLTNIMQLLDEMLARETAAEAEKREAEGAAEGPSLVADVKAAANGREEGRGDWSAPWQKLFARLRERLGGQGAGQGQEARDDMAGGRRRRARRSREGEGVEAQGESMPQFSPAAASGIGGGSSKAREGEREGSPGCVGDPMQNPVVSPPLRARRILDLAESELVGTEGELAGRC